MSSESRTKFIFQMSQDIEALKKAEGQTQQEQKKLKECVDGEVKAAIAEAQKTADEAKRMLEELKSEQEALKARVKSLEDQFSSSEERLNGVMKKEVQNLERVLSQESKARDQGAWDVFGRKMAAASEQTQETLQSFKAEMDRGVDAKIEEVMKATRKVREGEKQLSSIEKQLTRSEKLVKAAENMAGKIDAVKRTADEALDLAKKGAQAPAPAAPAAAAIEDKDQVPEAVLNQLSMMEGRVNQQLTKIECAGQLDHARVQDAINKIEQERESLVQVLQQELQKMRQENSRIIAEQVEKRVAQELEWRDAARTQAEAAAAAPKEAPAEEAKAAEEPAESKPKSNSFVEEFLSKYGLLDAYGARFMQMGYDSELSIKLMDASDLDTLGITALGHRRILLNAVASLNKASGKQ